MTFSLACRSWELFSCLVTFLKAMARACFNAKEGSLGSSHCWWGLWVYISGCQSTATYHNKFAYTPLLSSCTRLAWKKYRIFFNTNWLVSEILLCIVSTASCMNHETGVDGKATLLHSKRSQSKNLSGISIPGSIHI